MKRISLDDLLHTRQNLTYQEQYGYKIYLFHHDFRGLLSGTSSGENPLMIAYKGHSLSLDTQSVMEVILSLIESR